MIKVYGDICVIGFWAMQDVLVPKHPQKKKCFIRKRS